MKDINFPYLSPFMSFMYGTTLPAINLEVKGLSKKYKTFLIEWMILSNAPKGLIERDDKTMKKQARSFRHPQKKHNH